MNIIKNSARFAVMLFAIGVLVSLGSAQEQDTTCFPKCRAGYICHQGVCVSKCNPPCPQGEICTPQGECIPVVPTTPKETKIEVIEESQAETPQIECVSMFIARPDFSTISDRSEFKSDELISASVMVGDAIADQYPQSKTIDAAEIKYVRKCKAAQLLVARVEKYYREPSFAGQYIGVITISLSFYAHTTDLEAATKEQYSAKGKRHWGHSEPLMNALKAVCEKIRNSSRN